MSPLINQTQEESSERFDLFNDSMELSNNRYTIFGEEIEKRTSEVTKRKMNLPEFATSPDNEI